MEALIYTESPIAEYLEAAAVPFEPAQPSPSPRCTSSFAPRGLPKIRERFRTLRQTAASVTDVANDEFLERFRYTIVASQLLSEDPKPRRELPEDEALAPNTHSVTGALITAALSFSIAWLLHWLRRHSHTNSLDWADVCTSALLTFGGLALMGYLARRQYLDLVRRSTDGELERCIRISQNFDAVASEALRFVLEVEVVSRGYSVSQPLPPVSRLEELISKTHCQDLRSSTAIALIASIKRFIEAHTEIQPFVRNLDRKRYHDIYEVSTEDYEEATAFAKGTVAGPHDSLKDLRLIFKLHTTARKVLLCDLLALHSGSTWYNIQQWRAVLRLLQGLCFEGHKAHQELRASIVQAEFGGDELAEGAEDNSPPDNGEKEASTPQKRHTKAQMRRFDAVANAIRSLNAKVHLLREEINAAASKGDDTSFSITLSQHYEHLGSDIRNALVEWEKGRNTMFLNAGTESDYRFSRASGIRSPTSPSPSSLGGITVVDGGPAEALRLLSGEDKVLSENEALDEEVFEAVALPRKRMSWAPMSREEKLTKLQEERRKRATLYDHTEQTTNMLRELQMVLKHRPQSRSIARIASL